MTLNLARNFLLLPFIHRASALKKLNVLDDDELSNLFKSESAQALEIYKVAFGRLRERNQIRDLEHVVMNLHNLDLRERN